MVPFGSDTSLKLELGYQCLIFRVIDHYGQFQNGCRKIHDFLVCRLDKLLSWFSTETSVVNFRYYLFCLCNVRRQYLLPGILGLYCFLTGIRSLPAIALPKGSICSLVNQVYTSFPLMSLPNLACTDSMLVKCCAIIYDTLPTLNQHCVGVLSCQCSLQK